MKSTFNYLNFEYTFERRRYGATGTMKFFTWLLYRKIGTLEWKTFGDPWPKPRLNKKELQEALDKISLLTIMPNDKLETHLGEAYVIGMKGAYLMVQLIGVGEVPLAPGMIVKVL